MIAAISGLCFGGGLGLALCTDLRYAATGTRFCMPAAKLGLGYDFEGMQSIVRHLGFAGAAEAFFTARVFNAPLTVRAAKMAMRGIADGLSQPSEAITQATVACFESSDYAEGRRAFAQKRPPVFTGQ